MTTTNYTNYTNMDARFCRAYERGDRLVKGWSDFVDAGPGDTVEHTLEQLFMRHNRDDRPDGQLCPSMSVGDVVAIETDAGSETWSVEDIGFVKVDVDANDLITDRTWREVER